MEMIINFVVSGRTGDLIHCLFVVNSLCEMTKSKANILITDNHFYGGNRFLHDINKTYCDLFDLIQFQEYVDSFEILSSKISSNFINLNNWRKSELLYKTNWIDILCNCYNIEIKNPVQPWINFEFSEEYKDLILIHRSTNRQSDVFPWHKIVKQNKCTFITSEDSIDEWESFLFKKEVDLLTYKNLSDLALYIKSCKFFIGNQSMPLALAHAMGKSRLAELYEADQNHYIGEKKYFNNYFYITHHGLQSTDGIERYITL